MAGIEVKSATRVIDEMTGMVREQAESLVPEEVRRKLYEPVSKRLVVILAYLVMGTLLGWQNGWSLFGWWTGGLIGFWLLDLDYLLDVFFLHGDEPTSQEVKTALRTRNWHQGWRLLLKTASDRKRLVLHSIIFEAIVAVLSIYVVTSSGGLFAKGLVLAFWWRMLFEQVKEFMKTGKMESWFWQIKEPVPSNLQAVFLTAGIIVWVVLSLGAW